MKNSSIPFRVSRVLLATALLPAALATASPVQAEMGSTLLLAERVAVQKSPAPETQAGIPLVPKRVVSPNVAPLVEAAERGHGPAQRQLGAIYDKGAPGTPRDFAESMRWYQKAREQGEEIPTPHTFRAVP
ncbi:MAG TPA: hypothetical protein VIS77_12595 [Burkholderiales bacterium]